MTLEHLEVELQPREGLALRTRPSPRASGERRSRGEFIGVGRRPPEGGGKLPRGHYFDFRPDELGLLCRPRQSFTRGIRAVHADEIVLLVTGCSGHCHSPLIQMPPGHPVRRIAALTAGRPLTVVKSDYPPALPDAATVQPRWRRSHGTGSLPGCIGAAWPCPCAPSVRR
jgi:hypothetical protein